MHTVKVISLGQVKNFTFDYFKDIFGRDHNTRPLNCT